jgi:GNAT superfamily N-acetyltransferase
MVEIRTLSLHNLTPEERALLPSHQYETAHGSILALAAYDQAKPVAILVAFYYPRLKSSKLKRLFVLPAFRNQGIAKALADAALKWLKEQSITHLEMRFESENPSFDAIQSLLKKFHCTDPRPIMIRYFFDPLVFTPDWLTNPPALPHGQELFLWSERTSEEQKQVERWVKANPLIEYLNPLDEELPYEPLTSVGLRDKSGLIGWMATHVADTRLLCYRAFYIHSEHRGLGSAVALLAKSIRLHAAKLPQYAGLAEIQQQNTSSFWKKFVKKRLLPFSIKTNQLYSSYLIDF